MGYLSLAAFAAEHLVVGALLLAVSYILGRREATGLESGSLAEQVFFATTTGMGIVSVVTMLLGLVGALHPFVVMATFAILLGACYPVWLELWGATGIKSTTVLRKAARRSAPAAARATEKQEVGTGRAESSSKAAQHGSAEDGPSGRCWVWRVTWTLATMVALAPMTILPLYPPTAFDATMYHLPYAKEYVEVGGIAYTPYLRNPVFPQYGEMLFSVMLLLHDDLSAQFTQLLMAFLTGLGVYSWGGRLVGPRAGLWAAACWFAHPLVLKLSGIAYIDVGLTLFLLGALYSLANWLKTDKQAWLCISAFCCGIALGTKYSAMFGVGLMGLAVVWQSVRIRAWRPVVLFSFAAIAVAAPWYLRNFYYTGNPVFPYFANIFGSTTWSLEDLAAHEQMVKTVGGKKSLALFAKVPWNLVHHPEMFAAMAPLAKSAFWLLPAAIWALVRLPVMRWIAIFGILNVVFWFLTAQQLRYLLPMLPLLALIIAIGCDDLVSRLIAPNKMRLHTALAVLLAAFLLKPGWYATYQHWRALGPPPYNEEKRNAYLRRHVPTFRAYEFMNRNFGRHYVLYGFYCEDTVYFCDGTQIGDHYGPGHYIKHRAWLGNAKKLWQELRKLKVNYLLFRLEFGLPFPRDPETSRYFARVYKDEKAEVYRLLTRD